MCRDVQDCIGIGCYPLLVGGHEDNVQDMSKKGWCHAWPV